MEKELEYELKIRNLISPPRCFANYCKNDLSCQNCVKKKECKQITPPKEPEWCNPS